MVEPVPPFSFGLLRTLQSNVYGATTSTTPYRDMIYLQALNDRLIQIIPPFGDTEF